MAEKHPVIWRAFHAPKGGCAEEEYEDAFAVNAGHGRFAVADGASESSYAGLWARLLANGFAGSGAPEEEGNGWLVPLRKRWAAEVDGRPLPWYAEVKRAEGAFAAFLGLSLQSAGNTWQTCAVGDSCFFHVRNGVLLRAFPMEHAAEFDNRPRLLGARPDDDWQPERAAGVWRAGDQFLVMTDALAQWFLREHEAGHRPAPEIALMAARPGFNLWLADLRARGALRNDDVTLLVIEL